ncbi:hypothetical protein HPB49_013096 [Dermacentor silvarum]|uniref:Uncharacterized protein n=1 Tax=Dermacentor silvarum TaxID=543639 RepID=A0ACB8CXX4_DERSI|nr:hypothetical protein HPB49_013096 [Dermacentor silvarum]
MSASSTIHSEPGSKAYKTVDEAVSTAASALEACGDDAGDVQYSPGPATPSMEFWTRAWIEWPRALCYYSLGCSSSRVQASCTRCRRRPRLRECNLYQVAKEASQDSLHCRMPVTRRRHRIRGAVAAPRHLLLFSSNQHQHLMVPAAVAVASSDSCYPAGSVSGRQGHLPEPPITAVPYFLEPPCCPLSSALSPLSAASTQVSRCALQSQCGAQGMVATATKGSRWPWHPCCSIGSGLHSQTMCCQPFFPTKVPADLTRSEAGMVRYSQLLLILAIWQARQRRFRTVATVPSSHSEHHHPWTASPTVPVTVLENLRSSGEDSYQSHHP